MKKKALPWKNSIRGQLAMVFILLLLVEVGASALMNTVFLQRYYISNKKNKIEKVYETIDGLSEGEGAGSAEFKEGVDRLASESSILVVIADPGMNILYTTERESWRIASRLLWKIISGDPDYEPGNNTQDEAQAFDKKRSTKMTRCLALPIRTI
ncbi:MAG: hypothetical protein J5966_00115 [Lachnospiraceae bacterium]|nr:hypothetical protein [Lachnospiraceae bacterium]